MRLPYLALCLFVCLLSAATTAFGQTQLGAGSLSGTVQYANGAVIVGASVTVSNPGTGLVRTAETNDSNSARSGSMSSITSSSMWTMSA